MYTTNAFLHLSTSFTQHTINEKMANMFVVVIVASKHFLFVPHFLCAYDFLCKYKYKKMLNCYKLICHIYAL